MHPNDMVRRFHLESAGCFVGLILCDLNHASINRVAGLDAVHIEDLKPKVPSP
jgi:hypothetical protein